MSIHHIRSWASEYGLLLRGGIRVQANDVKPVPVIDGADAVILLFGQAGSAVWRHFAQSPENTDGAPDAMDRWSARVGHLLAEKSGGTVLFPFEGPPWYPFLQWAQRAESIPPSPLGILMHPQYGLWHAYRFAIVLTVPVEGFDELEQPPEEGTQSVHACDHCAAQPCLASCPVGAFTEGQYDVVSCAAYLRSNEESDCHQLGCLARAACPEGQAHVYELAHRRFHLQQFHASLKESSQDS